MAPELNESDPRLWRYPRTSRVVGVLAGGSDGMRNELGTATIDLNLGVDVGSTLIHDFTLPDGAGAPGTPAARFYAGYRCA